MIALHQVIRFRISIIAISVFPVCCSSEEGISWWNSEDSVRRWPTGDPLCIWENQDQGQIWICDSWQVSKLNHMLHLYIFIACRELWINVYSRCPFELIAPMDTVKHNSQWCMRLQDKDSIWGYEHHVPCNFLQQPICASLTICNSIKINDQLGMHMHG